MENPKSHLPSFPLRAWELAHYRDRLRAARYAALADAEGFGEICFEVEALGLRLFNKQADMGKYRESIKLVADKSPLFGVLVDKSPSHFTKFDALYETVRRARNDAMHAGAYARHATEAAIELCIGLEDALMAHGARCTVADVMVKSPMIVEDWQPVARARQLMLMHSFSFLPVYLEGNWTLVSELGLAKYLNVSNGKRFTRLAKSILEAQRDGMEFVEIAKKTLLTPNKRLDEVLSEAKVQDGPMLWLVLQEDEEQHLVGVLSPFELM